MILDEALIGTEAPDDDTVFPPLGDVAFVEHLQGSFERSLAAADLALRLATKHGGTLEYHGDLLGALSAAALGNGVTARQRLSVLVNKLEASPHPAAGNDLRLALGASALIDKRNGVAATLLAGLEPETVSTNLLGLLTRHYQARARAQVAEGKWNAARTSSARDIACLVADEVSSVRAAGPDVS